MQTEIGSQAGIALLDWVSEKAQEQLVKGTILCSPSRFTEGDYSLLIQRMPGSPANTVRVDALVPEGRKLLVKGCKFDLWAGETHIASGTVVWRGG